MISLLTFKSNFSEPYKRSVQQIVQQEVHQKVPNNSIALLIKQFVFTMLVESFY